MSSKYGVDLTKDRVEDLKQMYFVFLQSVIPKGDAPLTGQEADAIRAFKDALGLSDEAAAPVHLDVGRFMTRQGAEAASREGNAQERKV